MLFIYKAIDQNAEKKDGMIEAVSVDVAITALQKRGLIVASVVPKEDRGILERFSFFNSASTKEVVFVSRQMATLFEAQVSALRVFKLLAAQVESQVLRRAMNAVADDLQEGSSISKALTKHPNVFSDFYVNMVKAGEESGRLEETFTYLADYLERQYEVTSKAKHALIYPAFVIATFIAVMIMMLTVIIPKVTPILEESGQELPIYTKVVIWISDFAVNYGIFTAVILIVGAFFGAQYVRRSGRQSFDEFKLSIPFIGNLFRKLYLSRIADNMNTMIVSGISMIRTLETTAMVVGSDVYKNILLNSLQQVKAGKALSVALAEYPEIPNIMTQMVKVGEETGELGNILKTLAKFYQKEVIAAVDA
ncbi:MAG: type II secretion system F family protein, partial [Patescibacteria group bacterium]